MTVMHAVVGVGRVRLFITHFLNQSGERGAVKAALLQLRNACSRLCRRFLYLFVHTDYLVQFFTSVKVRPAKRRIVIPIIQIFDILVAFILSSVSDFLSILYADLQFGRIKDKKVR